MTDPMQEIRDSFFVECEELLEALQDGLAELESSGKDAETINVVFRAVHSIKGGAGAFGLDDLVGFAHAFETVLDAVRAEELDPDADHMRLFFRCADILSDLVRAARDDTVPDAAAIDGVVAELEALAGDGAAEDDVVDFQPAAISLDLGLPPLDLGPPEPLPRTWTISFRPHAALFQTGHEPVFLLQALAELGPLSTTCDRTALPGLDDLEPEACTLSWVTTLTTDKAEDEIREVFEFAEGLCDLEIVDGRSVADAPLAPSAPPPALVAVPTDEGVPDMPTAANPVPPPLVEPETRTAQRAPAASPAMDPGSESGRAEAGRGRKTGATVRVDLDRIERLVNLVGELVINQAMLSQSFNEAGLAGDTQIASGLDEFLQLTRDIQDSVMMIRAQPVKSLFQRMGRIVREASDAVGKSARLVTEGDTTEIDKTMIERLSDPLTHMIRNAVDHGLERPEARAAAGKPREGTITLTAGHRSGRVVIDISDDGGGINRPRVQAIAEERGLIAPGLTLGDSDIDNLLFLPGFSTASEVSALSGRGVGMDVVKSAISALGGRVSIQSAPGQGTTFSISLPLTLAVLDGMVVRSAGETLVVPISAVVETLTLRAEDLTSLSPKSRVVRVRDSFVPLLDLAALLGYAPPRAEFSGAIALLISRDDGTSAALVVDDIVDQRQVVIKGLEESYGRVPGVAAATILGDGQIALILDPSDLMSPDNLRPSPPLALSEAV